MLDLHIALSFLTKPAIDRIGASLKSDPSDTAPGWYLRAYKDEGYNDIVKYTRVPDALVEQIAALVDDHSDTDLYSAVQREIIDADRHRDELIARLRKRIDADQQMLAALNAEDERS